jgi:hypothetical protein
VEALPFLGVAAAAAAVVPAVLLIVMLAPGSAARLCDGFELPLSALQAAEAKSSPWASWCKEATTLVGEMTAGEGDTAQLPPVICPAVAGP